MSVIEVFSGIERELIDYGVINKIYLRKNIFSGTGMVLKNFSFLQDEFQKSVVKIYLKVRMRTCCKQKRTPNLLGVHTYHLVIFFTSAALFESFLI